MDGCTTSVNGPWLTDTIRGEADGTGKILNRWEDGKR